MMRLFQMAALAVLATTPLGAQSTAPIRAKAIVEDVRKLSSDAFLGRGPGQLGEAATLAYLQAQFAAAGLKPGGPDGSWTQDVPLVRLDPSAISFDLRVRGQALALERGRDWSVSGSHEGRADIANAGLVFAGFGIHAPDLGWDDFSGTDLRGKVVLVLPNDPDFDQLQGPFGGRSRSLHGRGGAKTRLALARGAAGVITIHRTQLTSWPWQQIANSDGEPTFRLQSTPAPTGPTRLQGYISDTLAAHLFRTAGLDLELLIKRAQQPGFRAIEVSGVTLGGGVTVTATPMITRNFVARLDGTDRADETVIFGAHWDAYGVGSANAAGDTIRNGAVDNAIGTATLVEVARAFARAPRTKRTLLFIGYTSEEDGLLGAFHYAAQPLRPLETTAAVFNLDPHLALGRTRSVELIGAGRTTLEADLARHARAQGRRIEPEISPEAGWYQRSDHFAFAEAGVPTVYFRAGRDLVIGGRNAGDALVNGYNQTCYHQRCDEFDPSWNLVSAAQDGQLVYAVGRDVANSDRWPSWLAASEYRALREQSTRRRR